MAHDTSDAPIIVWFRQDLRLHDNHALISAANTNRPLVALFVLDEESARPWSPGAASQWWLHQSLKSLNKDLENHGGGLVLRRGCARTEVLEVAKALKATAVHASRVYEPWAGTLESNLAVELNGRGIEFYLSPGALLHDPESLKTHNGTPFRVYTPFLRAYMANLASPSTIDHPEKLSFQENTKNLSDNLDDWKLLPTHPDWAEGFRENWQPGERGAQKRLEDFIANAVYDYAEGRDKPGTPVTSKLSPHLHFGEISPHTVWHAVSASAQRSNASDKSIVKFQQELVWREFAAHLLYHNPKLPEQPFQPKFAKFPWCEDRELLRLWQKGKTGYPIVDAGMRELWATGWMHNRVRMIVASFLIKDLLIPWQEGEAWFWDTLVDADLASNSASWQWVAGSGADAAPFFRIFNPVMQGNKFDPEGRYVRHWVPELSKLPAKYLHAPWDADAETLQKAGVVLGSTYPRPIVDHRLARDRALQAYNTIKQ